jgi:hypothetical protein
MSKDAMEQIIGRLVIDQKFRRQVAADRVQALAGYDLTVDEQAALAGLDLAELEGPASSLEERVSKGLTAN